MSSSPRYNRIAVIGAGPAGLAAVKALKDENIFSEIRVFDRRHDVGGMWAYDAEPDKFQPRYTEAEQPSEIPIDLRLDNPCLVPAAPEKPGLRNATYADMDTNAGARSMAFTYSPIPLVNSEASVCKFGPNNSTRPRKTVLKYIQDLFEPYRELLRLETSVEKVEKSTSSSCWILSLRKRHNEKSSDQDYWWQERFDAVVVASGHFAIAKVPEIEGLVETAAVFPDKFEHSKSFRCKHDYAEKKVIIVGGRVSAADLADDLRDVVQGPLYVSLKPDEDDFLNDAFNLPNVVKTTNIKRISPDAGGTVEFANGQVMTGFDKIIFATGYRLSYPFLPYPAVTPHNRVPGLYQHVFKIGDPSLVFVGQVRVAITFRVFEYQAVAISRYFAGRTRPLPTVEAQEEWEQQRLEDRGPTELFHEIRPDFAEYYDWLRDFAGSPAEGTQGYVLPRFSRDWIDSDVEVLLDKASYWSELTWEYFSRKIGAT